jgi:hypothetical protein
VSDEQNDFVKRHAPAAGQYAPRGPRGPKGDQGARGVQGALPVRARRSLLARDIVIIALLLLNFLFTAHYVNSSNHTWCQTLDLLTKAPVAEPADPASNPSRVQAYRYYVTFYDQRQRLGCG